MEQINRVELRGIVGTVNTQIFGDERLARFSLVTNRAYRDRSGVPVMDTEWHNVSVWENKFTPDIDFIKKGAKVNVFGRLHYERYSNADGVEKYITEIQAAKVSLIDPDTALESEM